VDGDSGKLYVEGKMHSCLAEKNKVAASKWRSLSNEDKQRFNDKAAAMNKKEELELVDMEKETKKLLDQLCDLVRIVMLFMLILWCWH